MSESGAAWQVRVVDQARTRELRRSVLRPHLGANDALPGDELATAVHLGVIAADGTALCTCFVYPDPCPWRPDRPRAWHLRQMATDPDHRGRGLAAAVASATIAHLRGLDASLLWCHARESAAGFYARQGFAVHGAGFTSHGIPHRAMWLDLAEPFGSPTPSTR